MNSKAVYLMRGLPSCGKSYTARKLAGDSGIVCETDEFYYTQVGDDPTHYDYREELLQEARHWNLQRFRKALAAGSSLIVVDRGNALCAETQIYARLALEHGYPVELREPESPWWQEIRRLLKDKDRNMPALYAWADRLSEMSRSGHRVPVSTIRRRIDRWKCDLTVEDILRYQPRRNGVAAQASATTEDPQHPCDIHFVQFENSSVDDLLLTGLALDLIQHGGPPERQD